MADFIASLAPERFDNGDVCKREGLWGLVGRGTNWRSNGTRVRAGDRTFVWRGGRPNGFIAELEALGADATDRRTRGQGALGRP